MNLKFKIKKLKFNGGFTLIEIVVGMSILAVAVLLISSFGLDIFNSQISFGRAIEIEQEVQQTFKILVPELRSLEPSVNGSFPISQAGSLSLEFYSDTDNDGLSEKIRYFLENNTLKRSITPPSGSPPVYDLGDEKIKEVIHDLTNASSPIFYYYDKNYTGSEPTLAFPINIPDIRVIKIQITVDPDIVGSSPLIFSAQATPRNLR
ncbi:MAG: prepilin-type N-terminal cleavage/methylation domain-containing protein [bacterium]|nr:prepilin-type N-terminal cleavage/methylation domain-containing protein [bacterium]